MEGRWLSLKVFSQAYDKSKQKYVPSDLAEGKPAESMVFKSSLQTFR